MSITTNVIQYEYQILRYRHDIVSGEFVNIGITLWIADFGILIGEN